MEEEDAEDIGRDVSSYYISKMEGVQPLEPLVADEIPATEPSNSFLVEGDGAESSADIHASN